MMILQLKIYRKEMKKNQEQLDERNKRFEDLV
jgi:hypothetical protein